MTVIDVCGFFFVVVVTVAGIQNIVYCCWRYYRCYRCLWHRRRRRCTRRRGTLALCFHQLVVVLVIEREEQVKKKYEEEAVQETGKGGRGMSNGSCWGWRIDDRVQ